MVDYEWFDVGNWLSVREMEGYSDVKDNVYLVDSENVFVKSKKNVGVVGWRLFVFGKIKGKCLNPSPVSQGLP
jgi:mannose-1-phosphate guanylyltransferase